MPGFNSIDGLVSGLNTSEIVDQIMAFERRPAVLLEQEQAQKQAMVSAFQALSAKFIGLNSATIPLSSKITFESSSINISNEDVLTATSSGRVTKGSFDFQVLSLARNHQIASQGFNNNDAQSFGTGTITLQVGNGNLKEITITEENNSLSGIKDAINEAHIGISASLVNDGSSSKGYRLILTADKTGADNNIQFNTNLTGGTDSFNFTAASFDDPESISVHEDTTSALTLGTTASYTGNENKTYSFTVAGTGSQTIGSDVITIDWTDGTDSGSIVVTQADTEVELAGAGSDGLKLMFSAGTLNAGDTFNVDTFAPLLQQASDASIAFGGGGGTGSPITINSSTNTFKDIIENVDITVKQITDPGESVSINTDIDVGAIKEKIEKFIKSYNELTKFIDDQNKYTEGDQAAPILFGDSTIWTISNSLRRSIGSIVKGIDSKFNQLYSVGIRTNGDGSLALKDSSALETALRENLDDVIKLFSDSGNSSIDGITYLNSNEETKENIPFDVDITQAATKGGFRGTNLTDPATTPIVLDSENNRIKFKVDGLVSDEIILTEKSYDSTTELIDELQEKINNDPKIGNRDIVVEWIDNGDGTGYIEFKSGTYGESSKIELDQNIVDSVFSTLNLSGGSLYKGQDVEGTINGEEATGKGQILSGNKDNEMTEGLRLKITLTEADIIDGIEGSIEVVKGFASRQVDFVNSVTKSKSGIFERKIGSIQKQIESMTERIEDIDERLELRRESLYMQFLEMETALSQLKSEGDYLTSQIASLNSNWLFNQK